MARIIFFLALFISGTLASAPGATSLVNARRAQLALGPEIWSEVVRIEGGAHSGRLPKSRHALVFEVAGILWFYTDSEGTQSLSLQLGRVEADKLNLAPLLHQIEPELVAWQIVPESALPVTTQGGHLPKGCFIESLAALRLRRERGEIALNARLLSIYFDPDAGLPGHTVLVYGTEQGLEIIDPNYPKQAQHFPVGLADDARALARALVNSTVAQARWVPVDSPLGQARSPAGRLALGGAIGNSATMVY